MRSSNIKFLNDRADEIQKMELSEDQRLRIFRRFLVSHDHGRFKSLSSLQEARELVSSQGIWLDGIQPPRLKNAEQSRQFIRAFTAVMNEENESDQAIPPPPDLGTFLRFANGVEDPDFRGDAICEWAPGPDSTFEPNDVLENTDIEEFKRHVRGAMIDDDDSSKISYELDVKAGIRTGEKLRFHETWWSFYLYCCPRIPLGVKPGWGWRIFFTTTSTAADDELVWDSIPDFLNWYGSWADRLIVEDVHDTYYPSDEDGDFWGDPDLSIGKHVPH